MGKIYITGYVYTTPIKTIFKIFYIKIIVLHWLYGGTWSRLLVSPQIHSPLSFFLIQWNFFNLRIIALQCSAFSPFRIEREILAGCKAAQNKDYISQHPLQVGVATWQFWPMDISGRVLWVPLGLFKEIAQVHTLSLLFVPFSTGCQEYVVGGGLSYWSMKLGVIS